MIAIETAYYYYDLLTIISTKNYYDCTRFVGSYLKIYRVRFVLRHSVQCTVDLNSVRKYLHLSADAVQIASFHGTIPLHKHRNRSLLTVTADTSSNGVNEFYFLMSRL